MMYKHCEYKNHDVDVGIQIHCYVDAKNGITEYIYICEDCYLEHLQKYYPDSRVTIYLTEQREEWNAKTNRN